MDQKLKERATCYEALAYYEARANAAFADGRVDVGMVFASKWHELKASLDPEYYK